MAVIENAHTPEAVAAWREELKTMDRATLMATQLVQRGAEDALKTLQAHGVTADNCAQMLASVRDGLFSIHEAAHARGIELISYTDEKGRT